MCILESVLVDLYIFFLRNTMFMKQYVQCFCALNQPVHIHSDPDGMKGEEEKI